MPDHVETSHRAGVGQGAVSEAVGRTRRGVVVDQVIAELAAGLPEDGADAPTRSQRLSFVGIGASGDTRPFDIRRERDELASHKLADGI